MSAVAGTTRRRAPVKGRLEWVKPGRPHYEQIFSAANIGRRCLLGATTAMLHRAG
jgi:hypothetical protein